MPNCTRCDGNGSFDFEEDNRIFTDTCYHCGGTGKISEEELWHDRLAMVAKHMAFDIVSAYRKVRNEDPDGEGWDFCAAENGMSPWDYFQVCVMDKQDEMMSKLIDLPLEMQQVLVAWSEMPAEEPVAKIPLPKKESAFIESSVENDILF